ncbi:MAG TPA: RNase adapter RapZ [Acidobacteriaceae bacterium]|jgi:UPF0042 nucleotide-binding protein
MPRKGAPPASPRPARNAKHDSARAPHDGVPRELVIITGLSGSGKASALKAFEDLGYYSVDNLPLDLLPAFADLVQQSAEIQRAALVVDVREGQRLDQFPDLLRKLRKVLPTQVFFLEASDAALLRRFSETRRPHPLGRTETVVKAIDAERRLLDPIRKMADETVDTSQHNVHELRAFILSKFERGSSSDTKNLMVSFVSFGYKNGVPLEADLVFDVRFLPNPHFIPEFRPLTGKHPKVAQYIRQFPQTEEFLDKTTDLLLFLLPHYIQEGKSYLTVGFGCTGGQHRSVMIAEEIRKRLTRAGYRVKSAHRDMPR